MQSNQPFFFMKLLKTSGLSIVVWFLLGAILLGGAVVQLSSSNGKIAQKAVYLPALTEFLPTVLTGYSVSDSALGQTEGDQQAVKEILKYDDAILRSYSRGGLTLGVHIVYWLPESGELGENRSHSPDFCFPGAGWIPIKTQHELTLEFGKWRTVPSQYRIFTAGGRKTYLLFWHLRAGELSGHFMGAQDRWGARFPYLLKQFINAFPGGARSDEIFVRITSNEPFESESTQELIQLIAPALAKTGAFVTGIR